MTLDDVAAAAGVSRMTASYSYSRPERVAASTRSRVLEAAAELGFRGPDPSGRFLRQGALRCLGLVLGESLTYVFDDPEASRFVSGLAEECSATGYGLTIIPTGDDRDDASRVANAAVDAFVVWTTTADDPVLAAVRATRRPAVVHGGPQTEGLALVSIDNRAAARALALEVWATAATPAVLSFPIDRRHEVGVFEGLDPQQVPFPVTRDRLAGFQDAAADLGIVWDRVPVVVCSRNTARDGRDAIAGLDGSHLPDGIAAMSDQLAIGARDALLAAGRAIPADVTLGGFDDSEQAAGAELTSVRQSMREQGLRAARIALGRLESENDYLHEPWRITLRASTARSSPDS